MSDMERKLAQFRAKKEREEKLNQLKNKIQGFFKSPPKPKDEHSEQEPETDDYTHDSTSEEESLLLNNDATSISSDSIDDENLISFSYIDMLYYMLWFILWAILYKIFIEFQFGTVYFISSSIIFIYINTRTGPKKRNEVSAYSVFNKDCRSIDGTLKAEQFEREIRYGALR